MPQGPFSVVGPRALIRAKHVTELQDALLNTPTSEDVTNEITETVIPMVEDAIANDETVQDAIETAIDAEDIPGQISDGVDTKVADLELVQGKPVVAAPEIGIVFYDPDDPDNLGLVLTDIEGQLWPNTADYWSDVLADPVLGQYSMSQIDEDVSGYAFAITDEDGRIAFGVRTDGTVTSGESAGSGTGLSTYPSVDWAHWTDSLGAGLATLLAGMTGRAHYDGGIGGQLASHVAARQGAIPALVTLDGDEIPTSGSVEITTIVREPIRPPGTSILQGTITGTDGTPVLGNLSQDSGVFSFARINDGDAVPVAPGTPFLTTPGTAYIDRHQLIIAGRNSIGDVSSQNIAQTIWEMVQHQTSLQKRAIVCDVPKGASDDPGTMAEVDDWNTVWLPRTVPAQMFLLFSEKLLSDEAEAIAEITWTATDLDNIADGITPESFREDALHLNTLGQQVAAEFLFAEMQNRGWL